MTATPMVKRTRKPHHCRATPLHWLSAVCSELTRRSSSTSRAWFLDRANNAIADQVLGNEGARDCARRSDRVWRRQRAGAVRGGASRRVERLYFPVNTGKKH